MNVVPRPRLLRDSSKSQPEVEVKLATIIRKHKTNLHWTRLLSSPKALQLCAGLLVELAGEPRGRFLGQRRGPQVAEERLRGQATNLLACRAEAGGIGGDDDDPLAGAVLGREPLEERVGVRRVAHGEPAAFDVLAGAVEDENATRPLRRDEAREHVDELARIRE